MGVARGKKKKKGRACAAAARTPPHLQRWVRSGNGSRRVGCPHATPRGAGADARVGRGAGAAMEGEEDDFEHTLYACPSVRCFKVPPMTTQKGFNSGEWTNGDQIWTGRLRVVEKGSHTCRVLLEDTESGELFAECPVSWRSLLRCPGCESARARALRVAGAVGAHGRGRGRCQGARPERACACASC